MVKWKIYDCFNAKIEFLDASGTLWLPGHIRTPYNGYTYRKRLSVKILCFGSITYHIPMNEAHIRIRPADRKDWESCGYIPTPEEMGFHI